MLQRDAVAGRQTQEGTRAGNHQRHWRGASAHQRRPTAPHNGNQRNAPTRATTGFPPTRALYVHQTRTHAEARAENHRRHTTAAVFNQLPSTTLSGITILTHSRYKPTKSGNATKRGDSECPTRARTPGLLDYRDVIVGHSLRQQHHHLPQPRAYQKLATNSRSGGPVNTSRN